jgi:hypothetical protein
VILNDRVQKLIQTFRRLIGFSFAGTIWAFSWRSWDLSTSETLHCNKIWYFLLEYCFFLELWTGMRPQLLMGLEWYVVWDGMKSINVWTNLIFFFV